MISFQEFHVFDVVIFFKCITRLKQMQAHAQCTCCEHNRKFVETKNVFDEFYVKNERQHTIIRPIYKQSYQCTSNSVIDRNEACVFTMWRVR